MNKVFIAPRRYVQGPDTLKEAGSLISAIGKKALVLWDANVKGIVGETLIASLKDAGIEVVDVDFNGDSTKGEADRVAKIMSDEGVDVSLAVGGGKTLDTVKAAAAIAGSKVVTVPTIASNDSPTSSFTVWYDDDGNCTGFESWGVNPDLVLVDTQVIANGPLPAFVAGMGDALGTWVECDACSQVTAPNLAGGTSTLVAMAIAKLCYDVLMENGVGAMKAVEANTVNDAVEKVVEANVLMSGLGFESGGVATAHMVANCLPSFPECHGLMHGHEVGFGVITQLCLDKTFDDEKRIKIVDFEVAIGLPVTFADIGLEGVDRERLKVIGDICGGEGSLCANHPFEVTSEDIVNAMIAADELGRERKNAAGLA
ncbi:MAG: glycerol dehydrogenase [Kiritimatiellia bacterium]|jgi:glycerol dehydrogenase|nr:glycerol dehydrogenase [Kiritimatiellia bacterium]